MPWLKILLEFDLRPIVFQFIAIFPPGIEIDEGFCVPDTCTTRDTFSLVYVSKYLSHILLSCQPRVTVT